MGAVGLGGIVTTFIFGRNGKPQEKAGDTPKNPPKKKRR